MKKLLAGLLIGLVLATAGIVVAQNSRDSDNLIMRAFNPFIQYVGTFSLKNAAGTAIFSTSDSGIIYRATYSAVSTNNNQLATTGSGTVYVATATSGEQNFSLPTAATAGLVYTFVAADAGGEIRVNPIAGQTISIKASEGGASVVTAAGTGIKNTAASNVVGDHLTLISDGGTNWWLINQSGTWASQ